MKPVEGSDLLVEEGPHGLVWVQPIWKQNSAVPCVRSAYAAIANIPEFVTEEAGLQVTWVPLGSHKLVASRTE